MRSTCKPARSEARRDREAVQSDDRRTCCWPERHRGGVREKTSEIEKFTGAPGIFRTAEPLNNVSTASTHHCTVGGSLSRAADTDHRQDHASGESTTDATYGLERDPAGSGDA